MAKRSPDRSTSPRNVERADRDEEREARVAEMVTRLRKDGRMPVTQPAPSTSSKAPRSPRDR